MNEKHIVLVAGPNGSGKTTIAQAYAYEHALLYLGADQIADELSPVQWDNVRIQAGRVFLRRRWWRADQRRGSWQRGTAKIESSCRRPLFVLQVFLPLCLQLA